MEFPGILDRFFRYVKIDTQSDEESTSFPSTEKQYNLINLLKDELSQMGLQDVKVTDHGYVLATLPSNVDKKLPTIALIAHVDTSPDVSGKDVNPVIHENYNGKDLQISQDPPITLSVEENPVLKEKVGHTLITTDGTTLLGADNKAGVAEIISAVEYLINNNDIPRPEIRILFTPDEEVGRGTEKITVEEINADFGYTIDGDKLGVIENETFCADTIELNIQGINVHPGYAKNKLVNAIKVASALVDKLPKDSLSPETTENREGYVHPHHFSGGSESVTIKFLIRDFDNSGLDEKADYIKKLCRETEAEWKGSKIDVKVIESYRNMYQILKDHPEITEKAVEAIEMAGVAPVRKVIRGGTDGARLSFMGIPCPNIFTGGINFHSRKECITLEDMKKSSEVIVNLMRLWTK